MFKIYPLQLIFNPLIVKDSLKDTAFKNSINKCLVFIVFTFFLFAGKVYAQDKTVTILDDMSKEPVPSAVVMVSKTPYVTDFDGKVTITKKFLGFVTVEVTHVGYKTLNKGYDTTQDIPEVIYITAKTESLSEVVIRAKGSGLIKTSSTLTMKDMAKAVGGNLSESLAKVSGVHFSQSGATISKPSIHGMHSQRVAIYNNGIKFEGQQWGSDHGAEVDPAESESIEVLKGVSNLRYGAEAIGGVVMMKPKALKSFKEDVEGRVLMSVEDNSQKGTAGFNIGGRINKSPVTWRAHVNGKKAGDYSTAEYLVNNTGMRELSGSLAFGYNTKNWEHELYYSRFDQTLGVFYVSQMGGSVQSFDKLAAIGRPLVVFPFTYDIEDFKQDVLHQTVKLLNRRNFTEKSYFETVIGYQNNNRQEYEKRKVISSDVPVNDLKLHTVSLEGHYSNKNSKRFSFEMGGKGVFKNNINIPGTGREAIIPNYASLSYGAYLSGKVSLKKFKFEAGARYDNLFMSSAGIRLSSPYTDKKEYHVVSGKVGLSYQFLRYLTFISDFGYTARPPSVNELYINGLSHGTPIYQDGNINLKAEKGFKWLNTLNFSSKKLSVNLTGFYQPINGFIYDLFGQQRVLTPRGYMPIYSYTQNYAVFTGGDFDFDYEVTKHVSLSGGYSTMYPVNVDWLVYFNEFPPDKYKGGMDFNFPNFGSFEATTLDIGFEHVNKAIKVDNDGTAYSKTPDAYNLLNASLATTVNLGNTSKLQFMVKGDNLLNELYKDYTNRFRFFAHGKGRSVQFKTIYKF